VGSKTLLMLGAPLLFGDVASGFRPQCDGRNASLLVILETDLSL
jgi:hypothetical protein